MKKITAVTLENMVNSYDGSNGWRSKSVWIHWKDSDTGENDCAMVEIKNEAQEEYAKRLQDHLMK